MEVNEDNIHSYYDRIMSAKSKLENYLTGKIHSIAKELYSHDTNEADIKKLDGYYAVHIPIYVTYKVRLPDGSYIF